MFDTVQANRNTTALMECVVSVIEALKTNPDVSEDVLKSFPGWGMVDHLFAGTSKISSLLQHRLQNVLSDREYQSARNSILNQMFTPDWLVREVWELIQSLGYAGGKVLDVGCGLGQFYMGMPLGFDLNRYVGVELDCVTAEICARVNPEIDVIETDFMKWKHPKHQFDLAIGNIPFEDGVLDRSGLALHARIIKRIVEEMLKPNGLMCLITTTATLDKNGKDNAYVKFRESLCQHGVLLGAVRLPCGTFATTARTVDLWIFRKYAEGEERNLEQCFINSSPSTWHDSKGRQIPLNAYYQEYSHMAIGEWYLDKAAFGSSLGCKWEGDQPSLISTISDIFLLIGATTMQATTSSQKGNLIAIGEWAKFRVVHNKDKKGLELHFPVKPGREICDRLGNKGMKFGFIPRRTAISDGYWCRKIDTVTIEALEAFCSQYGASLEDRLKVDGVLDPETASMLNRYRKHRPADQPAYMSEDVEVDELDVPVTISYTEDGSEEEYVIQPPESFPADGSTRYHLQQLQTNRAHILPNHSSDKDAADIASFATGLNDLLGEDVPVAVDSEFDIMSIANFAMSLSDFMPSIITPEIQAEIDHKLALKLTPQERTMMRWALSPLPFVIVRVTQIAYLSALVQYKMQLQDQIKMFSAEQRAEFQQEIARLQSAMPVLERNGLCMFSVRDMITNFRKGFNREGKV